MSQVTVALLPLYLALYDKTDPGRRSKFSALLQRIEAQFTSAGLRVIQSPICCVEPEFRAAVESMKNGNADCIAAVHLAYSPSLESAAVLADSGMPLLFLDLTMDAHFGPDVDPARISYNHGIHGVQDLAAVLRRMKKPYGIVAGHVEDGRVFERATAYVRAAAAANAFEGMRTLRIGAPFAGMGDFAVPDESLRRAFGITVDTHPPEVLTGYVEAVTDAQIEAEYAADKVRFEVTAPEEVYRRSLRISLGLRALFETERYGAFTMNFAAFTEPGGPVNAVPFLEACKAMERGLGYAGEGDAVTAPLVGALSHGFGATTFTEMFCPDWAGNRIFFSHMGEVNPAIAAGKPRAIELDFPYTDAQNPIALACDYQQGPATLINLAPGPDDSFDLIAARVDVGGTAVHPGMQDAVRGWARPALSLPAFLEAYSRHGGTHHVALVYGDRIEAVESFGLYAGIPVTILS